MKKLGFLLLAALSAKSALAGEVGAQNPQIADRTALVVAITDTGVSSSWTSTPTSTKASADRKARLKDLNDQINTQVSEDLEKRIAERLELSFDH